MWRCTTLSNNDVKIIWKYGVPDESDLPFKHTDFFFSNTAMLSIPFLIQNKLLKMSH